MTRTVLFVNGPSQDGSDRFFGWPTSLLYAIAPSVSEMKAGQLDVEYKPRIFEPVSCVHGVNDEEARSAFREEMAGVDIVCASATYDSLYPTLQLFDEARAVNPSVVNVLGGPHFDEVHDIAEFNDLLCHPESVDFGVAGDGEFALEAVLRAITDGTGELRDMDGIPGRAWVYSHRGRAATSGRPLKLDELPFMPIELADGERHRNDFDIFVEGEGILPTAQMIAKRGCAYNCEYCSERRSLAYPNARSIDSLLGEVYLRKQQGFKAIFFDDSTFGLYPRLRELLQELEASGMVFGCLNRFDHLTNPGLVEAYRKAGFRYFYCAVEQFDDQALARMRKGENTKHMERAMRLLGDHGFAVGLSLLYGLEYETDESVAATLDFAERWVHEGVVRLVSESVLSYHPGTPAGRDRAGRFDRRPPNPGFPFDRFEEGQWYHPEHVTAPYLERVLRLSEDRFGDVLVRNRHSWYSRNGYVSAGLATATR